MWIFNKPEDFDCRNCIHNKPCEELEEIEKYDECTHPKQRYKYSWIERDTKSIFWTVSLGICGSEARRFKEKQC